jgi:ABC-2 type transport system permease protein
LAKYIAPKGLQNAGFKITAKLSARTREFKMKVYPAFAYVPVYFIYFALTGSTKHHQSLTESYISLQNTKSYIFLLYMCSLVLISLLGFVTQTEKFKSAWVYYAAPVKAPGGIIAGMYKAVVTLYFFPYTLFVSIISVLVWGPAIINDALLAFFLLLSYGLILSLFVAKGLPFSLPVQHKRGSSTAIVRIVLTLMADAIGFCHYLILRWEWLVWSLIPVAAVTYVALFYWYSKQTWDELEQGALID